MPNNCSNRLSVFGPADIVASFVRQANGPMPIYSNKYMTEEERFEMERKIADPPSSVLSFHALVPLGGYTPGMAYDDDSYNAEKSAWGVKWGAYDEKLVLHDAGLAVYDFVTAWAPPDSFLKAVSWNFRFPVINHHGALLFALSYTDELPYRGRTIYDAGQKAFQLFESSLMRPAWAQDLDGEEKYKESEKWRFEYIRSHDDWVRELRG